MSANLIAYLRSHFRWSALPEFLKGVVDAAHGEPTHAASPARSVRSRLTPSGGIAVIPMHGPITHRRGIFSEFFGGTSTISLQHDIRQADANSAVDTILLDVDSPGGEVDGTPELAAEVRRVRTPIIAVVNSLAASAAYWIASQADHLAITHSGLVGSIGVWILHTDLSRAMDAMGITHSFIFAGDRKVDANPFEPLTKIARRDLQREVNTVYGDFLTDVGRGRGVSATRVRSTYGDGRVYSARDAIRLGLVDEVATLDAVIRDLSRPGSRRRASLLERRRERQARIDQQHYLLKVKMRQLGIPERVERPSVSFAVERDRQIAYLAELATR